MDLTRVIEIVGLVLGSGALSSVITSWFNKKKSGAETDSIIVSNIMDWAMKLSARIDKLEAELVIKDKLIMELQVKVALLEKNGHK